MNKFDGVWNAPAYKRYKNFISTAADTEKVWICENEIIAVWPEQAYAQKLFPDSCIQCLNIHMFCKRLLNQYSSIAEVNVFPNGVDVTLVSPGKLYVDLQEELERIE